MPKINLTEPTAEQPIAETTWPPAMERTTVEAAAVMGPPRETITELIKISLVITETTTVPVTEEVLPATIQEAIKDHLRLPQGHMPQVQEAGHLVTGAVPQA